MPYTRFTKHKQKNIITLLSHHFKKIRLSKFINVKSVRSIKKFRSSYFMNKCDTNQRNNKQVRVFFFALISKFNRKHKA